MLLPDKYIQGASVVFSSVINGQLRGLKVAVAWQPSPGNSRSYLTLTAARKAPYGARL